MEKRMKAHNYFTITNGHEKTLATNTALGISDAIKNNIAYAKFIAFGSGGGIDASGKIINIIKVLPVTLSDINPDATKGILHAEYSAIFAASDAGIAFCELSLCSNIDGSGAVNYATISQIVVDSEKCEVSVTIFSEAQGDVKLCGGNNKIARFLLGESALVGNFEMACGQCTYPNIPLDRGVDTIIKRAPVTPMFSASGVAFETSALSLKVEFLVLCDGAPVLRILPDYPTETINSSCKVNLTLNAGIVPHFSYEVSNVTMNGTSVTGYEVTRSVSSNTRLANILPFNVGRVSRLVIDNKMRYIACVTASDVILLDSDKSGFKIIMRLPYKGEFVEVLRDGAVALWSDTLKIYKTASNAPYTMTEILMPCGTQNAIVMDGEYYHAATLSGGAITRYKISGNTATQVARVTAGAKQYLCRDGNFIAYFGTNCPIGVVSLTQHNAFAEGYILELCDFYANADFTVNDGLAFCRQATDSFVIHLDSQTLLYYATNANYALGNEVFACSEGNNIQIGYVDRWLGGLKSAINFTDLRRVIGVCKTQYMILALYDDGKIEGIYLNSVDISLYSKDFVYNNTINYIAKKKVVPPDTEVAKVRMELLV